MTQGKPLVAEPDPPVSGAHGYVFDRSGLLIYERQQTEFPGRCYQTFYVHEVDGIGEYYYHYDPDHPCLGVSWLSRDEEGRIYRTDSVGKQGNLITQTFEYDANGRVARVRRHGPNPPYGYVNDRRDLEYDDEGRVSKIVWVYEDGRRVVDFERPTTNRTLSQCRDRLVAALTEAILAALRETKLEAPLAALALAYVDADYQHRLPPTVAFATESDLLPDEDLDITWNPAEWGNYLPLQLDDELDSLCVSVSNDIWQNELFAEAKALLWDIAGKLAAAELPVPRSAAFVAYVTRPDIGNHAADVRRAASLETIALLEKKQLL
jgi:hypothetical protein